MSKRVIIFGVLLIIVIFGFPSSAESASWQFRADSLVISENGFRFEYPGLPNLNINENLSLPVLTIYLETISELNKSDFIVNPYGRIEIGSITPDILEYDNLTTSDEPYLQPPPRGCFETGTAVYDIRRISTQSFEGYAVSILPVSIDEDYGIVFNQVVSLSEFPKFQQVQNNYQMVSDLTIILQENYFSAAAVGKPGISNGVPLGYEYLIITTPELAEAFEELASFRNTTGMSAAVVLIDSIYANYSGIDSAEQIRNYLIDFYNAGGIYVLLGGNDITIPVRYAYYYNTSSPPSDGYYLMPTDLYYADLDGVWEVDGDGIWGEPNDDSPDLVPELIVGRLPVQTATSASQYITKLKNYLTNPGNGDFDYLTKSFFFSSDQMRDYPTEGQHGVIADDLPVNFDIDTVQGVETPSGDDSSPTNANGEASINNISEGYGFIHILAHGRSDGFLVKSANYGNWPASLIITAPQDYNHGSIVDLEKNNKTSLYYSLACNNGGFDLDTVGGVSSDWSLVERLISSDSSGAVGMVANSRWGWVYSSYHLQEAYTGYLFNEAEGNPAVAMYLSWVDYPYYRDLIYGQNYFGDPALKIYDSIPNVFNIEVIPQKGNYQIGLYNNGEKISSAFITISHEGTILETGFSDANGLYSIENELYYGSEYLFTAVKEGCTINQTVYTPSMGLSVDEENDTRPNEFELYQNYPNPFNPTTVIGYNLPVQSDVSLEIYNILGRSIKSFEICNQSSGEHSITWDGTDDYNNRVASGTYLYMLRAGDKKQSRKMVLIK